MGNSHRTSRRRTRQEIWTDILAAIGQERSRASRDPRPTRVQSASNLPHDRFWGHVTALEERGLVSVEPLQVTELGREFLRRFHELDALLRPAKATVQDVGPPPDASAGHVPPGWGEL